MRRITLSSRIENIAKRNQLQCLILKFCKICKEDEDFAKQYANEQVEAWMHHLDKAILCFEDLIKQKGIYDVQT